MNILQSGPGAKAQTEQGEDHRTRVAAVRRERMRHRLIESALKVFAEKGVDGTDIQDVIVAAKVSRGSFYNYFQTSSELMEAVFMLLGNELVSLIDSSTTLHRDPAKRISIGLRTVLHVAWQHQLLARFIAKVGLLPTLSDNSPSLQYLLRDIEEGIQIGRLHVDSAAPALAMAIGAAHSAICVKSLTVDLPDSFAEQVVYQIFLGLGLARLEARKLATENIEWIELPDDSLLKRTLRNEKP
jgi:AcrR family transcriptional regulator